MSPEVLNKAKAIFETRCNHSIESLEAVRIVPQLTTLPLLVFHDRNDPLLPHHNALDLTRVWENSELIGTLGTAIIPFLTIRQPSARHSRSFERSNTST